MGFKVQVINSIVKAPINPGVNGPGDTSCFDQYETEEELAEKDTPECDSELDPFADFDLQTAGSEQPSPTGRAGASTTLQPVEHPEITRVARNTDGLQRAASLTHTTQVTLQPGGGGHLRWRQHTKDRRRQSEFDADRLVQIRDTERLLLAFSYDEADAHKTNS